MSEYQIIHSTLDHILELAPKMRFEDVREIWCSHKSTPHRSLFASFRAAGPTYTGTIDGEVVAMMGVLSDPLGINGSPWMLASSELFNHRIACGRLSKKFIEFIDTSFLFLTNMVDARNTDSIKWLEWLGFEIHPAIPYGPFNLPFHPFSRSNN